ncbi:MAG: S41 family peptidase [Acidobacteria bacterium]|nr:MAG: S41 family peptidase [Acidobacteriota bacterium]PYQ79698.1 MAG: S41 family peptidase [Acidobacteriota bacterium]PYQ91048.1 MAG: S41 family peptidase [Acidobacteriota bacterium]PYR12380.1 MAG: S41 family peptidase [Acidobacteriota bacterium]
MRRYRPLPAVVFAIIVSALVGGLFGRSALATDDKIPDHYRAFTAALSAIENSYVDKVESDALVTGAIRGMLGTLDPHSSYFTPKEYAQMRERQEGRYYGIGVSIVAVDGDITAVTVFEGSPAYKKGIRSGDVIAKVNTKDAKGWTTEQAMRELRGPRGTTVDVEIRRRGYEALIPFQLTRDEVYIPTVPAYFMIDSTTGYIRMQDFGENTDRDVKHALHDLTSKGMRRLLFDIRNNPGGPLDQAIQVANEFLPRGRMIVYTRGRIANSDQDYRAKDDGEFTDIPIVLLANRNSASASEIVTGALQDHDRAYVVGETTFGKALVQSVYRISAGAGLALTTAHYYTPSGRLIQRPWDASFDEYLSYGLKDQSEVRQHAASELKHTDAGRPVYSGGGIEPDKRVVGQFEGFNPDRLGRQLYARQAFERFAQRFSAQGDTRVSGTSTGRKDVKPNFVVDDAMLADFREQLKGDRVRLDDEAFKKDIDFIRAMIRFRIDEAVFGIAEARRHLVGADPQAQAALAMFGEAQKLTELSKAGRTKAH